MTTYTLSNGSGANAEQSQVIVAGLPADGADVTDALNAPKLTYPPDPATVSALDQPVTWESQGDGVKDIVVLSGMGFRWVAWSWTPGAVSFKFPMPPTGVTLPTSQLGMQLILHDMPDLTQYAPRAATSRQYKVKF